MKIKPVKNYKKPLYAVAAAAAAGMLSGCTPELAGDVAVVDGAMDIPPDYTTTSEVMPEGTVEVQTEGTVHISDDEQQKINNFWVSYENEIKKKDEYLNAFAKHGYNLFLSDYDESEQCSACDFGNSLAKVAFDSRYLFVGFYTEDISDDFVYQSGKATDYGYIFNRYGYCVALIDINESTDGRIEEIVEAIVNDYRNFDEIDEPDETAVELAGDVVFVPDEEEELEIAGGITLAPDETCAVVEEFSLAGDIAIPPDYNADNMGMEYAEQYISAFAEKGITLTETPDGDWGPFALGFETIPFIISLESTEHNIYLGFYSSENTALIDEIKNAGGVSFGYGYCLRVCHEDIYYKLVLIDTDSPHSEYTDFIADYVDLF